MTGGGGGGDGGGSGGGDGGGGHKSGGDGDGTGGGGGGKMGWHGFSQEVHISQAIWSLEIAVIVDMAWIIWTLFSEREKKRRKLKVKKIWKWEFGGANILRTSNAWNVTNTITWWKKVGDIYEENECVGLMD